MGISHPAIQRVVDAALRKGVRLEIELFQAPTRTAEQAAEALGVKLDQIVKSLVFVAPRPDGRLVPIVCLVSGCNSVDLGRLAAVTGELAVRRATAREAHELTGFPVGGIPPFGHGHPARVVMDPDLCPFQVVWAAAGIDGAIFAVAPAALRILSNAVVAPLAKETGLRGASAMAMDSGLLFEAGGSAA
ncbi:MAG TPA: YbaK/EbsC family protein [Candidatus Limnocylindrales bacterium]